MSINLTKKEDKINWYYSNEGSQIGPFELSDLLKQINGNTMVWREGIDWTTARLVPELSNYFPAEKSSNPSVSTSTFRMSSENDALTEPKKMFAASFSFDGRIRRTEYGISLIIYVIAATLINSLVKGAPIFGLCYIPLLWFLWAQGAKRCHDRNASGWFQIIPFYVFWMLFAEGDIMPNQYGENPKI
jgi:uncharacterized membrane protein YhaH (DUF805 family)